MGHWATALLISPSSPVGALSRIHINNASVVLDGEVHSSTGHISVNSLIIRQQMPATEFSLTFLNLSRIHVQVELRGDDITLRPLWWFPAFLERHPLLTRIEISLWQCEQPVTWRAIKDIAFLTPFYDAFHRQHLVSETSFSITHLTAERTSVTADRFALSAVEIELESHVLDVIRCIGSCMPVVRTLKLSYAGYWSHPRVSLADFVSVCHQSLADQVRLHLLGIDRMINEYHIPDHRHVMRELSQRVPRLLASGMPKLERIDISDTWSFAVKRDEAGEVQIWARSEDDDDYEYDD